LGWEYGGMRKGMCEGEEKRNRGLGGEERGQGGAIGIRTWGKGIGREEVGRGGEVELGSLP